MVIDTEKENETEQNERMISIQETKKFVHMLKKYGCIGRGIQIIIES